MDRLREYAGTDYHNTEFYLWLVKVDTLIQDIAGVRLLDLPDYPLRDAFEAGDDASNVAVQILEQM